MRKFREMGVTCATIAGKKLRKLRNKILRTQQMKFCEIGCGNIVSWHYWKIPEEFLGEVCCINERTVFDIGTFWCAMGNCFFFHPYPPMFGIGWGKMQPYPISGNLATTHTVNNAEKRFQKQYPLISSASFFTSNYECAPKGQWVRREPCVHHTLCDNRCPFWGSSVFLCNKYVVKMDEWDWKWKTYCFNLRWRSCYDRNYGP